MGSRSSFVIVVLVLVDVGVLLLLLRKFSKGEMYEDSVCQANICMSKRFLKCSMVVIIQDIQVTFLSKTRYLGRYSSCQLKFWNSFLATSTEDF